MLDVMAAARGRDLPRRMAEILANSGVETRATAMPPDYYIAPRGWTDRAKIFETVGADLSIRAATEALGRAGHRAADVDSIVFVSTTGMATPSLPSRLVETMGLRAGVQTVPVFGHGCAGGVLGLRLARDLAATGQLVLLVAMELCSLAYDHAQSDKKMAIASALFADGCAAAVVDGRGRGDGGGYGARLGAFDQRTWPGTIPMMGWEIAETGFDLVLSRDIPSFVERDFKPFCDAFLDAENIDPAQLAEPACHPGGGKVIAALERVFAGTPLAATRAVLAEHGNMSSPTVLFVLKKLLDADADRPFLTTALGPGFTGAVGMVHPA